MVTDVVLIRSGGFSLHGLCLLTPHLPGPLTPLTLRLVAVAHVNSPPLTHCDNYRRVNLVRLPSQSLAHRLPAGGFMYRPSLNNHKDNLWSSSLKFSTARNTILDIEKFFRVSRVSFTSLTETLFCWLSSQVLIAITQ